MIFVILLIYNILVSGIIFDRWVFKILLIFNLLVINLCFFIFIVLVFLLEIIMLNCIMGLCLKLIEILCLNYKYVRFFFVGNIFK